MRTDQKRNKISRGRGNPRSYPERLLCCLAVGTIARMDAAREDDEDRAALVRTAIEREIARRERLAR